MSEVILNYFKTIALVGVIFLIAWITARKAQIRTPSLCRGKARRACFLVGSAFLLVAAIGRLGWSIQTIDGHSPPERLDQVLFLILSLVGTFLLVFEYFAGHPTNVRE